MESKPGGLKMSFMGMKLYCQFEDDEQINLAALQLFLFLF